LFYSVEILVENKSEQGEIKFENINDKFIKNKNIKEDKEKKRFG
jgi:hypothetical protein